MYRPLCKVALVGSGIDEQGGSWAQSIFKVVDNLIEHDLTSETSKFRCPKCFCEFSTNDNAGNILALNIYLRSLSTWMQKETL